jgi:hypothetical protein
MTTLFKEDFEAGFSSFSDGETGGGGSVVIDRHADAAFNSAFGMRIACSSGTEENYHQHTFASPVEGNFLIHFYMNMEALAGTGGILPITMLNSDDEIIAFLGITVQSGVVSGFGGSGTLSGGGINNSGFHFIELQGAPNGSELRGELFLDGVSQGDGFLFAGNIAVAKLRVGAASKASGITGALYLDTLAMTNQTQRARRRAIEQAYQ